MLISREALSLLTFSLLGLGREYIFFNVDENIDILILLKNRIFLKNNKNKNTYKLIKFANKNFSS